MGVELDNSQKLGNVDSQRVHGDLIRPCVNHMRASIDFFRRPETVLGQCASVGDEAIGAQVERTKDSTTNQSRNQHTRTTEAFLKHQQC